MNEYISDKNIKTIFGKNKKLKVVGKNGQHLCDAHNINGDLLFIYGTGRIELILGLKYVRKGRFLQVLEKKKFTLIDKGVGRFG